MVINAIPTWGACDGLHRREGQVRRSSTALDRAQNQFDKDFSVLFNSTISNPYLTNCDAIAALLLRHKRLFAGALLCAVDRDNGFTLRSLSHVLRDGQLWQLNPSTTLKDFSAELMVGRNTRRLTFSNANSQCIFQVDRNTFTHEFGEKIKSLAQLYDHTVIASHNYRNYIGGKVYFHAKPKQRAAYYPKFKTVDEVCRKLASICKVKTRYFVYLGTRHPRTLNIESDFLTYDRKTIRTFCGKEPLEEQFLRDLGGAIAVRQSRVGKFQKKRDNSFYAIFPVYDPNVRGGDVPPDGVVVILSSKPFGQFEIRAAEDWLVSFSSKRHVQKASVLSLAFEFAEREIQKLGSQAGREQRLKCFARIARELFKRVCECTPAASVSLRIIDRDARALIKIAAHQSHWGHYYDEVVENRRDRAIPMEMVANSFIAFAASYRGADKVLHIEDVDKIPRRYRTLGLRQILQHHRFTRTEVVARVVAGKSLVALVNIEGPVSGSLRQHCSFFAECADFLGAIFQRLLSLTDYVGLATMAKSQVKLHSISGILRRWKDGDVDGAMKIARSLKEIQSGPSESDGAALSFPGGPDIRADIGAFNSSLKDWISYELGAKFGGDTKFDWKSVLEGEVPRRFDPDLLPSVYVITISIIENFLFRRSWERHKVRIVDEALGFPTSRRLTVEWNSEEPMDQLVDRNDILLKPLSGKLGFHYGFFLIGVHARHQGGVAEYVDTDGSKAKTSNGFRLTVALPYEPSSSLSRARRAAS